MGLLIGFSSSIFATDGALVGIQGELEQLLAAGPVNQAGKGRHGFTAEQVNAGILRFYRDRAFQPIWLAAGKPTQRAATLKSFLDSSADAGLEPEDYRVKDLARLWGQTNERSRAELELLLTLGFVRYVADNNEGRVDMRLLDQKHFADARDVKVDVAAVVRRGIEAPDLTSFLRRQEPQHPYYQELKNSLQHYRAIAQRGGWKSIPPGPTLKVGNADPRIPLLRQRLAVTGDLASKNFSSSMFDRELEAAVRNFQMRHYLTQDGTVSAGTLAAMNVPIEKRIRQMIINLERWRWVSRDLSGKQIFANIAGFNLVGMQDGHIELIMPVVVGKTYHQTPVFNERMTYVDFNPTWTVPPSIAANEYLPELRKNPASLMRKHIRILEGSGNSASEVNPQRINWKQVTPAMMGRYTLRQDPGPWNALGTVKFMFPNRYNVYLHDTAQPKFFAEHQRTFSHGCIRVSRPHELATWVLDGERSGWNLGRVKATVASGKSSTVRLERPIAVNILYRTVVIGEDEILRFRPDVYGRDAMLERAMFGS
ncbi:MAG TPA: L,D-transpeptidase family protein [Methylococcaceae bacterium]|nr:L,D-transpeptidase family protein [Methylococcaceae bacterium]